MEGGGPQSKEPAVPATVLLHNSMARVSFDRSRREVCLVLLRGDAPREDFERLKAAFVRIYATLREGGERVRLRFDLSGCGWVRPNPATATATSWSTLRWRARPTRSGWR